MGKTFGEKLRELRIAAGKSQRDVERELGLTQTAISQHERREAPPHARTIARYAAYFGVPVTYFVDSVNVDPMNRLPIQGLVDGCLEYMMTRPLVDVVEQRMRHDGIPAKAIRMVILAIEYAYQGQGVDDSGRNGETE